MIIFSKIKNANLSSLTENSFKINFKDVPDSEIAFLCYINKTLPSKFCPSKWKYNYKKSDVIYFNSFEKIQYKLFLMLHGYYILPIGFVVGLINGLYYYNQPNKIKETKKTGKSIVVGKYTFKIDSKNKIKKSDVKMIIKEFNKINWDWDKIPENLHIFTDIEADLYNEKK